MAVKIYIVKIYDPLRQCSSSKVLVWCERADDSGKWRSELKGRKAKRHDNSNQQQQAEDVFVCCFHKRCKKFSLTFLFEMVGDGWNEIWKIG
jgi:hypothetical protein